jgi:hypothetical protein
MKMTTDIPPLNRMAAPEELRMNIKRFSAQRAHPSGDCRRGRSGYAFPNGERDFSEACW